MPVAPAISYAELEARLSQLPAGRRHMIALVGPPSAGKSTMALHLDRHLNSGNPGIAAVMGMDGFHYDDAVLDAIGLRHRKGAPETFDLGGLRTALERLRRDDDETVALPVFDRAIETARAGALLVQPSVRVVIVEGNYLLLEWGGWGALRPYFDLTALISSDPAALRGRLINRWLEHGLDRDEAEAKVDGNDLPNARLVTEFGGTPDLLIA